MVSERLMGSPEININYNYLLNILLISLFVERLFHMVAAVIQLLLKKFDLINTQCFSVFVLKY